MNNANASFYVDPSAIVDDGAVIGAGTKIWHFSHITKGAVIGKNCSLGQNTYVSPTAVLGDGVKVQNNVSIYDQVIIGNRVFVGPSAVFTNVINPRAHIERKSEYKKTYVKDGATIGANVTVVCGVTLGEFCFIAAGAVVNKDVAPYELVAGVPAKRLGFMCECGHKMDFSKGAHDCKTCSKKYTLVNDKVQVTK